MYLFLAFLLVPLIEIALFIQVGGLIGLWPTLAIVVVTAILGTWLVRNQGLLAMQDLRRSFSDLNDPAEPLAHGAMILISGVLLLTPGFFTDAVGFLLLTPSVRRAIIRHAKSRVTIHEFQMGPDPRSSARPSARPSAHPGGDVIDGDFHEVPSDPDPNAPPSGWVQGPDRH